MKKLRHMQNQRTCDSKSVPQRSQGGMTVKVDQEHSTNMVEIQKKPLKWWYIQGSAC